PISFTNSSLTFASSILITDSRSSASFLTLPAITLSTCVYRSVLFIFCRFTNFPYLLFLCSLLFLLRYRGFSSFFFFLISLDNALLALRSDFLELVKAFLNSYSSCSCFSICSYNVWQSLQGSILIRSLFFQFFYPAS